MTAAVSDLNPQRTARGRPALSPRVYEIVILCLEVAAVVLIATGLGVAAFQLVRWPGFLAVCGAVLLAAGALGDWLGGCALATATPAPLSRPPTTRSKGDTDRKTLITRTWWRFAWLSVD